MTHIKKLFSFDSYSYAVIAAFSALVLVFIALPLLPETGTSTNASLQAVSVSAFGPSDFGSGASDFGTVGNDWGSGNFGNTDNTGDSTSNGDTTCTLSASKTSFNEGEYSSLTWTTHNATQVTLSGMGTVSQNGSQSISPQSTTEYVLVATGASGSVECKVNVSVTKTTQYKMPTCSIYGGPITITRGQSSTINWITENGTKVVMNEGVGEVGARGSKTVSPNDTTEYTITVTNPLGSVECSICIYVNPPVAVAPTCSFDATPTSMTKGNSATLSWNTTNASTVSINQGVGSVSQSGSRSVSPQTTTTYTLTATGNGGTVECQKTVTVTTPAPKAPTCTLSAGPNSVIKGHTASLSWTTQNTKSVSLSQGIGAVSLSGLKNVTPTTTTEYVLTAIGENSSVECRATVVVLTPQAPAPVCTLLSAPQSFTENGTTTLTWTTKNATTVSINQGIGSVSFNGSTTKSVATTTKFTLTVIGAGGQAQCESVVTVTPKQEEKKQPKCESFTVAPSPVIKGQRSLLSWRSSNATKATIDNAIGSVDVNGTKEITVDDARTYVLTLSNDIGTTTCEARTSVIADNGGGSSGGGGGGGSSAPRCALTASKKSIQSGESVVLTWDNTRTNEMNIKDENGKTIVDSEDSKNIDEDNGSVTVKPTKTTSYILTAIRNSQERECKVTITVESPVTLTSVRTQTPLVSGISLSQVPYTGFEAGPMLTMFFYALIALWGLGVAYFLVMRNGKNPKMNVSGGSVSTFMPQGEKTPVTPRVIDLPGNIAGEAPTNLPTGALPDMKAKDAPLGYGAYYESGAPGATSSSAPLTGNENDIAYLEARANAEQVIISKDALSFIASQSVLRSEQAEVLDTLIDVAKGFYPSEDGWTTITKERIAELLK